MAGPSIAVRVLGDLSGFAKAAAGAGAAAASAGDRIKGAFSSALATVNKTGVLGGFGEALDGIDAALDSVGEHAKTAGQKLLGIGGAAAGIGLGLQAIGSKDKAAQQQLQASIDATGKSYDDYEGQIESAIKSQEKFGNTANTTQDALRVLTQATGDPAKALQYLSTAADLAAAKHEDLTTAATQLGKAYNGNTKILKDFGLDAAPKAATAQKALVSAQNLVTTATAAQQKAQQRLSDLEAIDHTKKKLTIQDQIALRNAQDNVTTASAKVKAAQEKLSGASNTAAQATAGQANTMDALSAKLKGQASAAADTFSGKLHAMTAEVEDQAAKFGQKYGPAITAAGAAMTGLGAAMEVAGGISKAFKGAQDAQKVATEGAAAASDAQAAAETAADAAGLPLILTIGLIVLGIAALIAIAYVLYRNWSTIWAAIKAIAIDVWNWIKAHWPLLLDILLGPIGIAAGLIIKHWDDIRHWFQVALDAIIAAWNAFTKWLGGVAGYISRTVSGWWHAISDAFQDAVNAIYRIWSGLWSWFTGLPRDIANVAVGMWHGITAAFGAMIDEIGRLWSKLSFSTPKVHIPGTSINIPSVKIGVPHLAQGGLMTADGLVYAHAGEVISPAPASAMGGPAVVIQSATFASELDVDAFMRQVAWRVKVARV